MISGGEEPQGECVVARHEQLGGKQQRHHANRQHVLAGLGNEQQGGDEEAGEGADHAVDTTADAARRVDGGQRPGSGGHRPVGVIDSQHQTARAGR
jgi:hypothetical protein